MILRGAHYSSNKGKRHDAEVIACHAANAMLAAACDADNMSSKWPLFHLFGVFGLAKLNVILFNCCFISPRMEGGIWTVGGLEGSLCRGPLYIRSKR